ncbi:MAG TPA: hypothetical protein VF231_09685 [Candidatus Limnocylindrales bacterium]|jgi:hypothetical protein
MNTRVARATTIFGLAMALIGCSAASSPSPATSAESPAGSRVSAASLPADFPIGSWTTTITEDDLRAAGLTESAAFAENAGSFTLEMAADGTWTTTQVSDVAVKWPVFRGTWAATGRDTFSQTTEFPADYAGDIVDFSWRIDDGKLVLQVPEPPDPVLPIIVESHPWERVP